eukprot:1187944-Prorocentrum_minimum.AAC.2
MMGGSWRHRATRVEPAAVPWACLRAWISPAGPNVVVPKYSSGRTTGECPRFERVGPARHTRATMIAGDDACGREPREPQASKRDSSDDRNGRSRGQRAVPTPGSWHSQTCAAAMPVCRDVARKLSRLTHWPSRTRERTAKPRAERHSGWVGRVSGRARE